MGTAEAADEWFVMGEQTINSTDPSVEIEAEGGRWQKDVERVNFCVEGADVKITSVVLGWDNPKDVDAHQPRNPKGRRTRRLRRMLRDARGASDQVKVQYEILGDKPTATVKIFGD